MLDPVKRAASKRAYEVRHREKRLAATTAWKADHPEAVRAMAHSYRVAHPEAQTRYQERHGTEVRDRRRLRHEANRDAENEISRQYRVCHPEDPRRKRLYRHGLTAAEMDRLYTEQAGCCAICQRPVEIAKLCIDHDHATGERRGLLCHRCNGWLAAVESPDWLAAAAAYLQAPPLPRLRSAILALDVTESEAVT